jgi:hypothetical protein
LLHLYVVSLFLPPLLFSLSSLISLSLARLLPLSRLSLSLVLCLVSAIKKKNLPTRNELGNPIKLIKRTANADSVVDEVVITVLHNKKLPWLAPVRL